MKHKVVIKISKNEQKSRSKALKVIVGFQGVESVALQGQEKNQIEVVGNDIDTVMLMTLLRKNLGSADLVSVGPVGDNKDNKSGGQSTDKTVTPTPLPAYPYTYYPSSVPSHYYPVYEARESDPGCSIM